MADLLLKNLDAAFAKEGQEFAGADIRISDKTIAEIGIDLPRRKGERVIDCRGKVALPGLVNSHHHFFQILTRCLPGAQNAKLFDWLLLHYQVWRHLDALHFHAAARLAIAELLLTGCTTSSDHLYLFPRGIKDDLVGAEVQAARELGIRFSVARGSMSRGQSQGGLPPDEVVEGEEQILVHSDECIRLYHDPASLSMCQVHLAPCSPFNVTAELMVQTRRLAREHSARLHTHLAETLDELRYCRDTYHLTPLALMEDWGWLGDDVWFAHGVHFTEQELKRLAETSTGISHCPSSNMRLGSGSARVPKMIELGVTVGLAVDGSASNDSSDMLGEMKTALLANRLAFGSEAMSARQVIGLATQGSAGLLGRKDVGVLQPGYAADVAIFDLEKLQYAGAGDPIAALLFCGFDHRAWMVVVNGEIVVEDSRLARADEKEIADNAWVAARDLWKRSDVI